jgi:hypothetical protein
MEPAITPKSTQQLQQAARVSGTCAARAVRDRAPSPQQPPTSMTCRCFRDACPHRLAPLSEGRIEPTTGALFCNYHGWQFGPSGACTHVPQVRHTAGACSTCSHRAGALSPHAASGLVHCTPLWLRLTHAGRSVLEAGVSSAPPSCSSTWQASCCSTTACLSCHKQHVTPAYCSVLQLQCVVVSHSAHPRNHLPAHPPLPPAGAWRLCHQPQGLLRPVLPHQGG